MLQYGDGFRITIDGLIGKGLHRAADEVTPVVHLTGERLPAGAFDQLSDFLVDPFNESVAALQRANLRLSDEVVRTAWLSSEHERGAAHDDATTAAAYLALTRDMA